MSVRSPYHWKRSGDYTCISPDMLCWYNARFPPGRKVRILCYRKGLETIRGILGTVIYVDTWGTIYVAGNDGQEYDIKYMVDSCVPVE